MNTNQKLLVIVAALLLGAVWPPAFVVYIVAGFVWIFSATKPQITPLQAQPSEYQKGFQYGQDSAEWYKGMQAGYASVKPE